VVNICLAERGAEVALQGKLNSYAITIIFSIEFIRGVNIYSFFFFLTDVFQFQKGKILNFFVVTKVVNLLFTVDLRFRRK